LAEVIAKEQARLYFNGVLVGHASYPGSLNTAQRGERNYLGRDNWWDALNVADTAVEIDEFRVWKVPRTGQEIRENMFQRLSGKEPNLVCLLNFDDGTANDSSPRAHHAKLVGHATVVETPMPRPEELLPLISIRGATSDAEGKPLAGTTVNIVQNDSVVMTTTSDAAGHYEFGGGAPAAASFDLSATRGDLGTWQLDQRLRPNESQEINVRLPVAGAISGTLSALDESPHAAAVVEAVRPAGGGTNTLSGVRVIATARSNAGGNYRFVNLRLGPYQVRCPTGSGYVYHDGGKTFQFETGKVIPGIDLRFPPFKKGSWTTFNVANGLASDVQIRKILFEPNGVAWLATQGGVSRFDGKGFVNFTTEDGLPGNFIANIGRQSDGTLWFTTMGQGVSRYDGKKFTNFTQADGLAANEVHGIYVAPDDSIWFGSQGGVSRYDGKRFTTFTRTNGFPAGFAPKIAGSPDGKTVWFASNLGLVRFDGTNFVNVTKEAGLGEFTTDTPHVAPDGKVWFGSFNPGRGAWSYDGTNFVNYTTKDGLVHDNVSCTYSTPDGIVWFATSGGVSRFDGTNFVNFTREDGLPGNSCIFVTSSPDGVMWFGMGSEGAARYDAKTFASFTAADGLSESSVYHSLTAPDGTLWFTYGLNNQVGGATRFDGSKFASFSVRDGVPKAVSQMAASPSGELWFGTDAGLVRYDGSKFTRLTVADGLPSSFAPSVARATDGSLWIATRNGISHYTDGKFKNFGGADGLVNTDFNRAFCDTKGRLWFSHAGQPIGAVLFDGKAFQTFTATNGLAGNIVSGFYSDPDDTVWIGTDNGVSVWDGQRFVANYTRAKDRLVSSLVRCVFRDSRGVVWFGTPAGATRYDGNVWSTLTVRDGLIGNDVRTICEDKAGAIWFGTANGITRYHPSASAANTPTVAVEIDRKFENLSQLPPILRGRRVTFHLDVADHKTYADNRRFRYQFADGAATAADLKRSKSWSAPQKDAKFEWTSERAGHYTLAVQYIDRDLNYSEPALVPLRIEPPWYLNAWIAVPSFGTVGGLLVWAFVARSLYQRKRREAEQLRERLLEHERQARAALEAKNQELAVAKESADAANTAKSQFLASM
ncbi:MAG: hypothetical protein HY735_07245, partial [Verrucomicrobia bacterium]|nr:hypothetical protein [Verrucomicrobiota bacterium]